MKMDLGPKLHACHAKLMHVEAGFIQASINVMSVIWPFDYGFRTSSDANLRP